MSKFLGAAANAFSAAISDRGGAEPYSDTNAPASLEMTNASAPASPAAGSTVIWTTEGKSLWMKASDGATTSLVTIEPYVMGISGVLTVQTGKSRIYLEGNYLVESVRASVNTAPTGATLIVDVNKNGTTIYTTQTARPTIAISGFTALGGTPAITTFASGDYITIDLDQIGSTVAGSDLTVVVRLRRTF